MRIKNLFHVEPKDKEEKALFNQVMTVLFSNYLEVRQKQEAENLFRQSRYVTKANELTSSLKTSEKKLAEAQEALEKEREANRLLQNELDNLRKEQLTNMKQNRDTSVELNSLYNSINELWKNVDNVWICMNDVVEKKLRDTGLEDAIDAKQQGFKEETWENLDLIVD